MVQNVISNHIEVQMEGHTVLMCINLPPSWLDQCCGPGSSLPFLSYVALLFISLTVLCISSSVSRAAAPDAVWEREEFPNMDTTCTQTHTHTPTLRSQLPPHPPTPPTPTTCTHTPLLFPAWHEEVPLDNTACWEERHRRSQGVRSEGPAVSGQHLPSPQHC